MIYTDDNYFKQIFQKRKVDAHKGNFGKILIFAGSVGMAGAAILCGKAALKAGSGLVQYLLPSFESPLLTILQISVPEATCIEMKDTLDLSSYQAVVAGSGLGQSPAARKILTYIIDNYSGILVLDADALNMISESSLLKSRVLTSKSRIIITPHIGEARRLLHTCEGIYGLDSRKWAACSLAQQYNAVAVLKGSGTLVASVSADNSQEKPETVRNPLFSIYQNTTGNPGMATAGSGDSLAGLIGSFAGQGYSPVDAARMGVFIHGKAGDLAADALSEPGVTSSDIAAYIPAAIKLYY